MPTTYSGSPSFASDITLPSDGDGPTIKAADVNVALEALADRTVAICPIARLVGRKTFVNVANIEVIYPAPPPDPLTIFLSGIATEVGDEIEIHFAGDVDFTYGAGATDYNGVVVSLSAKQNGGSPTVIGSSKMTSATRALASNGSDNRSSVAIIAFLTISTPGSLEIDLSVGFASGIAAGDTLNLIGHKATLHQFRAVS